MGNSVNILGMLSFLAEGKCILEKGNKDVRSFQSSNRTKQDFGDNW